MRVHQKIMLENGAVGKMAMCTELSCGKQTEVKVPEKKSPPKISKYT